MYPSPTGILADTSTTDAEDREGLYEGFKTVDTLKQQTCHLLSLSLEELDQEAAALPSFKSQSLRLAALHWFKSGQAPILLTTDVGSRGPDIPAVDLVINYNIPRFPRDYVHCAGRTARAGRGGLSISFITQSEIDLVHGVEVVAGKKIEKFEYKEN